MNDYTMDEMRALMKLHGAQVRLYHNTKNVWYADYLPFASAYPEEVPGWFFTEHAALKAGFECFLKDQEKKRETQ